MFGAIVHGARRSKGFLLFGLMVSSVLWGLGCAPAAYQTSVEVQSTTDDVQYLSYYGQWVEIPPYGTVWRPDVVSGWSPFYNGHWVWSNYGWAWVSYEPFGWLVYHYGYWDYQPGIGWYWCPGDTWSPARVQWRTFGDYTAWAPLPPPNVYWPDPWDTYPVDVWVVVDVNNFTNENIGRHRVVGPIPRETIHARVVVKQAPDIRRVEVVTRKPVPLVKVKKQVINIRAERTAPATRYARPRSAKLERMALPPAEKSRMEKQMPQVEREVLTPKKGTPPPTPQPVEKKKKSDTSRKKKGG